MRHVKAVFSCIVSLAWLLGQRFGWDTLLAGTIVVVGSAVAVLMAG